MKKLVLIFLSFLSTSSLSETYVCSHDLERFGRKGEIETLVFERDGNSFKDQYQIYYESGPNLILTWIGELTPSFALVFINKDTKEWGMSFHNMGEYKKNPPDSTAYGKCVIVK